jgi:single-strand DNA-binding protein
VDGETTYYTVTCWRQLAVNAFQSLRKGDTVVVRGVLRGRDWRNGDRSGTTLEVTADHLGHDLARGTTIFRRSGAARPPVAQQQPAEIPHEALAAVGLPVPNEPAGDDVAVAI